MVSVEELKHSQQLHTLFPVGSEVEVSSDEEGFHGAWFVAKVLSAPSEASGNKLFLEYKTLVSDENELKPLREFADPSFVRPLPPHSLESEKDAPFELNDAVDAYYCDGWWSGVVTEVLGENCYKVSFHNPPDEIEFERSSLRIHRDWVDGQWVLPKEQRMSQLTFNPGTAVEVNLEVENSIDIWYLGTVIKEIDGGSFLVNCDRLNKIGRHEVVVSSHQIRPSPPSCNNKNFQLLDKVDAFNDSGWSSGVVTKVLSEGRYIVFFKHTRKEKELCLKDLRLPMLWANGKWVYSSQDGSVILNSQEAACVVYDLSDNSKVGVPYDKSALVKETGKKSSKGGENQAVPSETLSIDDINISTKRIKLPTEGNVTAQVCELMTTSVEWSTSKSESSLEVSNLVITGTNCLETSENTYQTYADPESQKRKLDIDGNQVELPTNEKTQAKRRRGWPKGRLRGTRRASLGKTQKKSAVNEGLFDPSVNSVVISLPCNSPRNSLHDASSCQLPEEGETWKVLREEKEQLEDSVKHGDLIGVESKNVKDEVIPPKRKRGRPFGSRKKSGAAKKPIGEQAKLAATSSRRRQNRRHPVKSIGKSAYEAVVDFGARTYISSRGRKVRTTMDLLCATRELQTPKGKKAEVALTSRVTKDAGTRQDEILDSISDDDRPLSTWYHETDSRPTIEHTKFGPVGHASGNHEVVERNYQVPQTAHQLMKETMMTERDACAAENMEQCGPNTREKENEMDTDSRTKGLPFSKSSPVWKMIESMAVFKQLPQKPHFHPLYDCKEHCREGLAIGSMVTFAGLVEKISKFQIDDPKTILEGSLETLLDLESQGFNVEAMRGRLRSLLEIKSKHEQACNQSKEIETLIAERHQEQAKLDEELSEIDQKIEELRGKRELALLERESEESEIVALKLNVEGMRESFEDACAEFRRVATSPW